mgnify:FL=1
MMRRRSAFSPGGIVFRRFRKNRLAVFGFLAIAMMFLFSFVGGQLSPYGQSEVFKRYEPMVRDRAVAAENGEFRFAPAPGTALDSGARSRMILAAGAGEAGFESGGNSYGLVREGEDFYRVTVRKLVASGVGIRGIYSLEPEPGVELPADFDEHFRRALEGDGAFAAGGAEYEVVASKGGAKVYRRSDAALASKRIFSGMDGYAFRLAAERALQTGEPFSANGQNYSIRLRGDGAAEFLDASGNVVSAASKWIVTAARAGDLLPDGFPEAVLRASSEGADEFEFGGASYAIERGEGGISIRSAQDVYVIDRYASPSGAHWLGTDLNGMDVLTRLMVGGRVSLMVGFVVVAVQTLLGVVLGGFAGYFGRWADEVVMRLADVFSSVPGYPIYIILGAVLEAEKASGEIRVLLLMAALGLLNWPAVARTVRAQILTLREREFMLAAEAAGLSVKRRVFRHLLPNAVAQLIVVDTMALGSVILTEATLSFLGLGVKFPLASWGSILSAASNVHVMANYWYAWIPAGALILVTVLGFNFIGDGLRDAFDPGARR